MIIICQSVQTFSLGAHKNNTCFGSEIRKQFLIANPYLKTPVNKGIMGSEIMGSTLIYMLPLFIPKYFMGLKTACPALSVFKLFAKDYQ